MRNHQYWGRWTLRWPHSWNTENRDFSRCQLCRHWRHRKLPKRQTTVPPATKKFPSQQLGFQWQIYGWWYVIQLALGNRLAGVNLYMEMTTGVNGVASTTMMTSSNGKKSALLALCERNQPATSGIPSQRAVTRVFAVYLICAWTKDGTKNRDADDLRRHHAHIDVTVMNVLLEARGSTHHAQQWPGSRCGFCCYLRISSASCNVWGRGWFLVSGKVSKSMAATAQLDPRVSGTASGFSRD